MSGKAKKKCEYLVFHGWVKKMNIEHEEHLKIELRSYTRLHEFARVLKKISLFVIKRLNVLLTTIKTDIQWQDLELYHR